MPRLSQLMIRAALIWLAAGVSSGAALLAAKGAPLPVWLWSLRLSHVFMLLVGWMAQLACGIAFWILPRLDVAGSRGDERPVWVSFVLLNIGVALAAAYGPLAALAPGAPLRWMPPGAALALLSGIAAFARHAWPRIRPFRILPRRDGA
jgi:hypothetical protein